MSIVNDGSQCTGPLEDCPSDFEFNNQNVVNVLPSDYEIVVEETKEDSTTVKEDTNTVQEDTNTVQEDTNTEKEDTSTV